VKLVEVDGGGGGVVLLVVERLQKDVGVGVVQLGIERVHQLPDAPVDAVIEELEFEQ